MLKRFRSRKTPNLDPVESNPSRGRTGELLGALLNTGSNSSRRSPSPSFSGLGLHVVHQPEFASFDIIFVHGLGGHSQRTWSKNHDPSLFWPGLWLPFEPDIAKARILTFGYNAAWRGATRSIASITDFAKELLFEMRFSRDDDGADLDIGKNPIIFVVHSMGGLVFKKAYLLGFLDENYKSIISSISAVIFLSTPHRGTNLAEILNNLLAISFQSSKNFISDLYKSSPAIEELNEQFRHLAPKLSIWSFYETLATSIGPKKIMVVEKESSVLGYPAEISKPLQADHHDVCKYSSPTDPNYINVKNAIKFLAAQFNRAAIKGADTKLFQTATNIQELFRDCSDTEDEYDSLKRLWIPNTCEWFLSETEIISWLEPSLESRILWFSAPPGNGKSVLSAFLINHIRKLGLPCQFFHFKYSDQNKRSIARGLVSLAMQLAKDIPEFRKALNGSSAESLSLDSGDPFLVWRNTFEHLFFNIEYREPIYWVIDALDESDAPKSLLQCLMSLLNAKAPLRVFILSRNADSISINMDKLSDIVPVTKLEKIGSGHNHGDIELLIKRELKHMRGSQQFLQQLIQIIVTRSEGNFLWAKLVLEEIMGCHTEEDINDVLEDIPDDMTQLYERMEQSLISSTRGSTNRLIRTLFEWCICAHRPLNLKEISQALQPEFQGFLDLKRTIKDACGQFIRVEESNAVSLLHYTARDYFMNSSKNFLIHPQWTHEKLLINTLRVLEDPELRWKLSQGEHALQTSEPFVFYSAVNWSFHLGQSNTTSSKCLDLLVKFFRGPSALIWIHAIGLLRQLEVLITASKVITSFVHNIECQNPVGNQTLDRSLDLEFVLKWATDLIKLVGKFPQTIISKPGMLYEIIPELCPTESMIYKQFASSTKIKVVGNECTKWSDHLCRHILPENAQALKISCAGKHVAVLDSTWIVHVWDSLNFLEITTISHGEPVTAMALNGNGTSLASYGMKSTKIWTIPSGDLLTSTANPPYTKALTITFAKNDRKLLLGGDDNIIRHIECDNFDSGWQILNPSLLKDTARLDGTLFSSPICLKFNGDKTQVAVSYRGAPLCVWRLHDGRCINRCKRVKDLRRRSSNWFAVDRLAWNPITGHVLGIYKDGSIFKWHPITDENIEAGTRWTADEITASLNGRLFATSSSDGSVRVWDFANFRVIYQLSSENLVTELSFSPDSRRFYDLRDGSINAWESNSLARFLESEEHINDTNSEDQSSTALSKFSEEWIGRFEVVTAFALAPDNTLYCVGYEDGTVTLFRRGNLEGIEFARFYNFLPVTHIKWSKNGNYVAVADLAGDIQVKVLDRHGTKNVAISSLPSPHINFNGHNIEQIILNHDGQRLFILTEEECFVCSTKDGNLQTSSNLAVKRSKSKWLCHPTEENTILAYGALEMHAYTWTGIENLYSMPYHDIHHSSVSETGVNNTSELEKMIDDNLSLNGETKSNRVISNAILTRDGSSILLHTHKILPKGVIENDSMISLIAKLPNNDNETYLPSLEVSRIPKEISSQIHIPLGIIHGSKLIFLDRHFWLWSYSINTTFSHGETCSKFYFIPRDWIGQNSASHCVLTEDGSLFWPRDDRVIIIDCNFDDTTFTSLF
ncbi:hypothetical protein F4781DRAFT_311348 [Annulohypoxylon bovei var. microspora]|nr:hypothetical protein F4781DRAFT_311348 [Annulohypoxylon bovei var. microspora]